jgi:5-hydroxyisourate hydrolase-like protein (transthyretin family)
VRTMRLFIAATALLTGITATAQSGGKLYPIAGVLTDSVTGEPVAGATMSLYGGPPQDREFIRSVQTDGAGRFALPPMPAGKYSLRAIRRGYLTEEFNEHTPFSSAIVTGEGQDTEHIPFHLDPGAVVRGAVTDDAGEPVENANVLLVRRVNSEGLGERLQTVSSGVTDDTGLFEFWGLYPGTYLLAVKAEPWFAVHPPLRVMTAADDEDRAAMAALDVAYPVTYYDGATEESAAAPIVVKSGERAQADVALHTVPALHLTVPTGGLPRGSIFGMRQTVLGNEGFAGGSGVSHPGHGSNEMEVDGVAPGHYTLMIGNPQREIEYDATGNQQVEPAEGAPTFSVTIRARMADGSQLPQGLQMVLSSRDTTQTHQWHMDAKGETQVRAVEPGEWNLSATGGTGLLGVVSIQSGTAAPLAESRVVVGDHDLTLHVVLAAGNTNVEGFAAKDGTHEAGVMLVLVPKNPDAHIVEFRRDQSDSDGSFSLQNVVPGEYTVVAIEDGWELDWAKPEVIGRYLKDGVAVTVPMNAPAVMKLSKTVVVQQK